MCTWYVGRFCPHSASFHLRQRPAAVRKDEWTRNLMLEDDGVIGREEDARGGGGVVWRLVGAGLQATAVKVPLREEVVQQAPVAGGGGGGRSGGRFSGCCWPPHHGVNHGPPSALQSNMRQSKNRIRRRVRNTNGLTGKKVTRPYSGYLCRAVFGALFPDPAGMDRRPNALPDTCEGQWCHQCIWWRTICHGRRRRAMRPSGRRWRHGAPCENTSKLCCFFSLLESSRPSTSFRKSVDLFEILLVTP
jgi:hypothetical protein